MVKVQGIVEQNKNAYHRTKKMKPKDYRPETYIKRVSGFCTKINATRAVCKDIKINNFLQNIMYLMKRYVLYKKVKLRKLGTM